MTLLWAVTHRFVSRIEIGTFSQKIAQMSEKCRKNRIEWEKPTYLINLWTLQKH
jgi:hypothetical protein